MDSKTYTIVLPFIYFTWFTFDYQICSSKQFICKGLKMFKNKYVIFLQFIFWRVKWLLSEYSLNGSQLFLTLPLLFALVFFKFVSLDEFCCESGFLFLVTTKLFLRSIDFCLFLLLCLAFLNFNNFIQFIIKLFDRRMQVHVMYFS